MASLYERVWVRHADAAPQGEAEVGLRLLRSGVIRSTGTR